MRAILVSNRADEFGGMRLGDHPYPRPSENDVVVRVEASGYTPGELTWPGTWSDRAGHNRTPSVPGHEFAGTVVELGYGTTGLTLGQRVFGLTDWTRDGTLAEFVAVEARNLAPLRADMDSVVAAAVPISGLTAWQGLFTHGGLQAGQSVLILGAAGGVGAIAVQLAVKAGLRVIGAGRSSHRDTVLGLGAHAFATTEMSSTGSQAGGLREVEEVDVTFDLIGGELAEQACARVRAGGRFVTIAGPTTVTPTRGTSVFFVVESDRKILGELATGVRQDRLRVPVGRVVDLQDAVAAFTDGQTHGKLIVRVGS